MPNFKLLVCTVYRPPGADSSFWNRFEYSIEQALNYTDNIIINGDLNIDLLKENRGRLNEIISLFNLRNVIKEPTRFGALLDPILVSNDNICIDSQVIEIDREISDHDATVINIKIPCLIKNSFLKKVWLYKNADFDKLNQEISGYPWEEYLNQYTDIDEMSEQFLHRYLEMISRNIPSKTVKIKVMDKP